MSFLESLKGFRTLIVAALTAVFGALIAFGYIEPQDPEVAATAAADQFEMVVGVVIMAIAAVQATLRMFTNTPAGAK